jgi:hypothetical protein
MTTLFDIEQAIGKDVTTIVDGIEAKKVERKSIEDALKEEIEIGTLVTLKRNTFRGVLKVLGMIYDYNKDKSSLWVETSEDIYNVDPKDVEVVKAKPTQAKKGFNHHKTKLTELAVKDIYLMATTTKMNHLAIANWVKVHHEIEIVPKTVSDIKLGKRWGKLTSTLNGA